MKTGEDLTELREGLTALLGGICVEPWDDGGEMICGRHGYHWEDGSQFCNGVLNSFDELILGGVVQ